MHFVVFGRTGQVATELARQAPAAGVTLTLIDRAAADLSDPAQIAPALTPLVDGADAVINATAWTAVDAAETEEETAHAVNALAPAEMARICAAAKGGQGVPFLHVSTDYVFDGTGTAPWKPDDATGPLGAYGRTKLAGEEGVRAAGGPHAILRTSWVFSAHGGNFVKTMLRVGATRDSLTVVADQTGGPTAAADIAAALLVMARAMAGGTEGGTFHFSGAPDTHWAGFAREIFARAGMTTQVEEITTAEFAAMQKTPPSHRPANSRMDCTTLQDRFGIARPDWRTSLDAVLAELKAAPPATT
ncbi:dTDP-4-dehydrorhamnose reductase [Oceanicola sp. 22II-s10i]|uniref:dTDP-4-dehydrorhamnose reductase n=1 Tax=Oceanicola sp. 22II-s10i TaxID=1317116 RepID=UPI000B524E1B|nr:dTDP-4-dehydrorhamnose reductase [Oceanicola sp. 22II-s10i]OWU82259.1 dTDP-4-dehydrorhamnose reductase [Oceanicola sp. 22II-s10i]